METAFIVSATVDGCDVPSGRMALSGFLNDVPMEMMARSASTATSGSGTGVSATSVSSSGAACSSTAAAPRPLTSSIRSRVSSSYSALLVSNSEKRLTSTMSPTVTVPSTTS